MAIDWQKILDTHERLNTQGNAELAHKKLLEPWPGMDDDIEAIELAMLFRARASADKTVKPFLESVTIQDQYLPDGSFNPDAVITVQMPQWFTDAQEDFLVRYDGAEAHARFLKAMATFQGRVLETSGRANKKRAG